MCTTEPNPRRVALPPSGWARWLIRWSGIWRTRAATSRCTTALLRRLGSGLANTGARRLTGADMVVNCVGNDDDLRGVTPGTDGAFAGMGLDTVFIDHTTASANVAREVFAAAHPSGVRFIDAPVSGGQAGAPNGVLTIVCGGDAAAFERVAPVLRHYAAAVTRIGGAGAGNAERAPDLPAGTQGSRLLPQRSATQRHDAAGHRVGRRVLCPMSSRSAGGGSRRRV